MAARDERILATTEATRLRQAAADAAQARADRIHRALEVERLAERLACSPLATTLSRGRLSNGGMTSDSFAAAVWEFAEALIDEGARRRMEAEADPPAEVNL